MEYAYEEVADYENQRLVCNAFVDVATNFNEFVEEHVTRGSEFVDDFLIRPHPAMEEPEDVVVFFDSRPEEEYDEEDKLLKDEHKLHYRNFKSRNGAEFDKQSGSFIWQKYQSSVFAMQSMSSNRTIGGYNVYSDVHDKINFVLSVSTNFEPLATVYAPVKVSNINLGEYVEDEESEDSDLPDYHQRHDTELHQYLLQDVRPHTNTGGKVTRMPTQMTTVQYTTLNVRRVPYVSIYTAVKEGFLAFIMNRKFELDKLLEYQVTTGRMIYSDDLFFENYNQKILSYNKPAELAYSTIYSTISMSNNLNMPHNLEQYKGQDVRNNTTEVLNFSRHNWMWYTFGSGTQGFRK